ncbi:Glutamate receptor ionotropic, kainate 2 [Araneus ventricosus]|uniref:Glutamate receptor ionotropic, kainate 2 n=1 Tax=Araneus ventricosus TaxID=182803 RepID=A0A4Y2QZY3_ARAVE|nr:Glutamate receptor ionotropic, kainate 2 [Araneus ventricosus]
MIRIKTEKYSISLTVKPSRSVFQNPPYMMIKKPEDQTKGSSELYEGFCVDLLKEMSRILGFRYELRLVRDGSYGSRNTRGEWNGMVRELMDREADLAIADFTITYEREKVVDFTMPFMNLGISILFRRPLRKIPKLFWFLRPLSLEVWLYVAAAYMSVSLLLYGVSRFSPYEWGPPHPCEGITVHACRNCFSIQNSLWFTVGSLMRQSSELTPRCILPGPESCLIVREPQGSPTSQMIRGITVYLFGDNPLNEINLSGMDTAYLLGVTAILARIDHSDTVRLPSCDYLSGENSLKEINRSDTERVYLPSLDRFHDWEESNIAKLSDYQSWLRQ